MTKMNLKTFSHIKKKSSSKTKEKQVVLRADRNLFGHMILVAESRQLHMSDVLSHPLGPHALANADGTLRKTNKASLARELEKMTSPAEFIPAGSATIIDGMSLVQRMKGNEQTFSQLSETILSIVLHEGGQSERIDVVFDVYKPMSIKEAERTNRGSEEGMEYRNIAPGHTIKQWRKLF